MRQRRLALVVLLTVANVVVGIAPPVSAVPGGNGTIAFLRLRSLSYRDDRTIFTIAPDGSDVTPLAVGTYSPPVWSPDGTQMAFVLFRKNRNAELQIANADATDVVTVLAPQDLPDGLHPSGDIAWMPDGQHLVVGMNENELDAGDLFVVGVDGTNLTRLTARSRYVIGPAVSNDGSTIAVSWLDGSARFRLTLMDVDASDRRVLDLGLEWAEALDPDWAPDDSAIVFALYDGQQTDLYTIAPDGSALTQITDTPTRWEWDPVFSPDGTLIAYERGGRDYRPTDLFTISVEGGTRRRLTDTPERWETGPSWQRILG